MRFPTCQDGQDGRPVWLFFLFAEELVFLLPLCIVVYIDVDSDEQFNLVNLPTLVILRVVVCLDKLAKKRV